MSTLAETVERADFGSPSAAKRGRDPRWPYVPVVDHGSYTSQILGQAWETRALAVQAAGQHLVRLRRHLAEQLADPRMRALREQYGLPRELVS